jgi:hypothetical protein
MGWQIGGRMQKDAEVRIMGIEGDLNKSSIQWFVQFEAHVKAINRKSRMKTRLESLYWPASPPVITGDRRIHRVVAQIKRSLPVGMILASHSRQWKVERHLDQHCAQRRNATERFSFNEIRTESSRSAKRRPAPD